jgi:hypothetical protein
VICLAKNRSVNPENQSLKDKSEQSANAINGFNNNGNAGKQAGRINTKGKK